MQQLANYIVTVTLQRSETRLSAAAQRSSLTEQTNSELLKDFLSQTIVDSIFCKSKTSSEPESVLTTCDLQIKKQHLML